MAGFTHKWYGDKLKEDMRAKAKRATTGAAADTVTLCQQPNRAVGWPRVTGFLAGSTGFEAAVETEDGVTSRVVARAEYAGIVNRKTQTMNRNGDAMGKTIGKRIKRS